jgi:hypothetical protein
VDTSHTGQNKAQFKQCDPAVHDRLNWNHFTSWQGIRTEKASQANLGNRHQRRKMKQKFYHRVAHLMLEMARAMALKHGLRFPPIVVIGKMAVASLSLTNFLAKHFAVIVLDEYMTSKR